MAYVGDANNVARSLAIACGKLGLELVVATPDRYRFDQPFLDRLAREVPRAKLTQTTDPREAVRGASIVYTDVWTSMGQEQEDAQRQKDFAGYQVDQQLMSEADEDAVFLHCLPARRGQEVTDEVIDGPQSAVLQQASNRMHAQKGLLAWLLGAQA
jgi:ornithine carbamoyltransferase